MRKRLTYANVMSTIAVFIALGGASYAVTQLPPNSVGTSQIKRHAITSSKFAPGATAPNAARLGGRRPSFYRLHCRAGTRAALGVCFAPSERLAGDFYQAVDTCEHLGGRLPTVGEMVGALEVPGLLPNPAQLEITGDGTYPTGGPPQYLAAPELPVGFQPEPTGTSMPYRCVFVPSN